MSSIIASKSDIENDIIIEKYLRSVKSELHCSRSKKNQLISQLRTDLLLFSAEHKIDDIADIIVEFGSPRDIGTSLLSETEFKAIRRSMKINRHISVAILTVVIVTAIALIGINTADYIKKENYRNGYYVETITYGPPPSYENTEVLGVD